MMTLVASPKTIQTPAALTTSRRTPAAPKQSPARPSFWLTLMRALAAPAI